MVPIDDVLANSSGLRAASIRAWLAVRTLRWAVADAVASGGLRMVTGVARLATLLARAIRGPL